MRPLLIAAAFWLPAVALAGAPVPLVTTEVAPVRVEKSGNVFFADFGKDAFGNLQVEFPGGAPDAQMKVRLGEKLADDGKIDRHPPGSVNFKELSLSTQFGGHTYRLQIPERKAPVKTPPEIGEITPFRYVEIECPPDALAGMVVHQLAVHAPFDENASAFASSDDTLNAVWDLCKHTTKAVTAFGIYIDGERERTPYEADAYIATLCHNASDLDPRVTRATFEFLLQHPTWPTEWSLVMPMIAWADYEATGDPILASDHYEALKGKLLMNKAPDDGLLHSTAIVDWPAGERDHYNNGASNARQVGPEINTVANAYYYHALMCMAELAGALGKDDEASALRARAAKVYQAFNDTFFDATAGTYRDGEGSSHASLHANMFALAFGLVPVARQAGVADFVVSRGMACSVYGAQFLLEGLYMAGKGDAALALMTAHTDRSWFHMMDIGSTMTTEAWDGSVKPNLTWNHVWGAAPANIIPRFLLGVRPLKPGYAGILIAPQPASLKWMRGKVPTPHGPVSVSWQQAPATLDIDVPAGATAKVILPPGYFANPFWINGKKVTGKLEDGALVIEPFPTGHFVLSAAVPAAPVSGSAPISGTAPAR